MSDGGSANEAGASGSGRPAIPGMRGLMGRRPSAPITPGRLPSIRSRDLTLGGVKKLQAERHRIQTFTAIDEHVAKRGLQTLDKENGRHFRPQDNVLMTNIGDGPESNWNPPTQPMSAPQIRDRTDTVLETVRLKYEPKRLELVQEIASLQKQIVQCERELAFQKSKRHRELELADKLHQEKFELSNKPWQREFELTDMFWQKEITLASTPWQEEIVPGVQQGQQNMKLNGIPWQQELEIVHKPWQEVFELVKPWQRNVDLVNQQWQRLVQLVVKQQQNEVKLADKLQQSKLELVSQLQQQNMELVNKPLPSEHTLSNKPWQRELELVYKPSLRDYELVYKPWKKDLELFENPATSEKTFTPNIISRKIKEEPKEELYLKKEKKDRDRDRQRDGTGRGRGRPEIIQSHSIFEQGPAEMMKKKGNWDSPMDMADLGPSHIINIKKEKRETEEETKNILRMLEKDDFIDDPGLKNDTRNTPVQLPLALSGWLFKEESDDQDWQSDSKEVKMEVDHPVKVKEEPMDADDVKDALPDLKPTVSKKVPGLLPDLSLPQLLENLNLTKEEDLLFLQLPDTLPGQPPTQDSRPVKTEVQTEDGQTMLVKQEKSQEAKLAENTCCLGDLAEGLVGKLLIRKSGKVQLVLGKVTLDVTMGTSSSFLQELVSVGLGDGRQGDMTVLGHIKHKLVCSPDFESLLENKQ